jgi:hypothetical protein
VRPRHGLSLAQRHASVGISAPGGSARSDWAASLAPFRVGESHQPLTGDVAWAILLLAALTAAVALLVASKLGTSAALQAATLVSRAWRLFPIHVADARRSGHATSWPQGRLDVGLVFLARAAPGIRPARFAEPGTLDRSEGTQTTIVGYGTTTPRNRHAPVDTAMWDGKRRIRTSTLRTVVDETWGLWSIPSYVCSGDSGGCIFLNPSPTLANEDVLANRLDTRSIQDWINDLLRQHAGGT